MFEAWIDAAGNQSAQFSSYTGAVGSRATVINHNVGVQDAGISSFAYDNLGRLTGATYPGSTSESFGYDATGNRTSASASGTTTTYAYNDANEITGSTVAGVTSTYAYDAAGNRTSITVPPPPDTSAPTTPTNLSATAVSDSEIDLAWSASSDNYGVTSYRIYRDGALLATVSGSSTSLADVTAQPSTAYAYTISATDAAGNASSQSTSAGDTTATGTIGPDTTAPSVPTALSGTAVAGGRVDLSWSASTDDVAVAGYNLYRDGTKINPVPIGSTSYSDTGLASGVGHTWTVSALDAAGNESAQSSGWTGAAGSGASVIGYSYDPENRLTQVTNDSQLIGSYAYNGLGDRVSKTVGATTTTYTTDLATDLPQVLCESTGSSATYYVYAFAGGTGPLEVEINGTPYWYLTDSEGSVRLVTDINGNSPSTYSYTAFGNIRIQTGTLLNEILFAGQRTDAETGLQYLRARTYDPATGTFLQRDTWAGRAWASQSQNRYLYAQGDPFNRTDPSGRDCGIFDPVGCASDLLGGVGNAVSNPLGTWADTGGSVVGWTEDRAASAVDYGVKHPSQILAVAAVAGACITGVLCGAVIGGAALGVLSYGASHAVHQWQAGKNPWDDINLDDLATQTVIGEATGGVFGAGEVGFSAATSGMGLSVRQLAVAHLGWLPLEGGTTATANLLLSHATGQPSAIDDLCTIGNSFLGLSDILSTVATVGCGGVSGLHGT